MANQEHVDLLRREDVQNFNLWRRENPDIVPDLSESYFSESADLSRVNFSGANLERIDLSGVNITLADFSKSNLTGAILFRAILAGSACRIRRMPLY